MEVQLPRLCRIFETLKNDRLKEVVRFMEVQLARLCRIFGTLKNDRLIHLINNSRRVTSIGEWVFVSIQN